jgi:uncharacterized repeat protein (TIGR01451 family)
MNASIQQFEPNAILLTSGDSPHAQATSSNFRNPGGHFGWAGLVAGLLLLLFSAAPAGAHQNPPGCTGSGLGIDLFTDSPDVHIGDTLNYSVTVLNGTGGGTVVCDATAIQAFLVTPDNVSHTITLVRTTLSNGQSDFYSNVVSYIVRAQDVHPDGTVRATASDTGIIHQNDTDSQGGGNQGVNTEVSLPCIQLTVQCLGSIGENGAITFTGTVTNCGNNTLVGVTVTNFVDNLQFTVLFPTNLLMGQVAGFSGSWIPANPCSPSTVTLVAQGIDRFTTHPRTVTSTANTTCAEVLTPGIKVTKLCPAQPVSPGQLLTFSGSVSNTGNVTLTNIVVVDNQPSPNTPVFTRSSLAPGEVADFTGSYTAPASCSVTDTLTATAASRCGVGVSSVASATCPILTTPQIKVTANCSANPVTPGGLLTYGGTVTNSGDITLTNVVVVSDHPAANTRVFTVATLAPGAGANYTGSYTVPANACAVTTTVTATGQDICNGSMAANTVSATCTVTTAPAVAVTLACPAVPVATGGLITYSGTVRNSGNVILNNVTVVNNQALPSTVLTVPSLAPGASANFTASFSAPADACSVSSTVTASGSDNCTGTVVNNSASATCTLVTAPRIVVTQNCPAGSTSLGGVLTYSGSVSNAGNITLTNVVVTNDHSGTTPIFTVATLAPGALANFTGSYTVPANGSCAITSTLTANAHDECTGTLVTANATATCPVEGAPNITVSLACPATPTSLGGLLTFSGTVRNAGNVTVTNVVVSRSAPAPSTVVFSVASLAPGASANFTGSYTVPGSDVCSIITAVSASANDQCAGSGVIASASIDCPLVATPRILVTQTCPASPVAPGGLSVYSGSVSNAGNITLTNITVVSSQPVPNTVVFTLGSLAPGASASFSSSFNAPLDACSSTSTLTATGQNQCNGNAVNNSVTTTCPLVTAPQISVTKACPITPVTEGGLLVFTGTVTNTGNITLTNVLVVSDHPAANTPVLGPITLAPGVGTNFTGSYTAPLNACSVTETLTASGKDKCDGTTASNSTTTTCPITTAPAIAVTLACPTVPAGTGGPITYSGTVRNSGNVTLNNVTVVNDQAVPNTVLTLPSLAPGASASFTASFTAPVDACSVSSMVTATGSDACTAINVSNTASATCPLATAPRIIVTQNCPANPVSVGGVLTYSGSVSNAGNITLTNVMVTSDHSGTTPVFTVATLAPGVSASFTGSYTVPAGSACSVTSMVTVTANDTCTGIRVTANASSTCPLLTTPAITVTQTCPVVLVSPGGILTYSGSVSNAGNITLTNILVVNNRPASNTVIFTVATLVPGATTNFTGSYEVPLNCCVSSSTVDATGQDICTGATVADTFTATCTTLTLPKIFVTKVCPATPVQPGEVLQYSGSVSNAGNIALVNVTIVNTQPSAGSPVLGPIALAPGESVNYYASYIVPPDFCGADTVTARGLDACTFAPVVSSVTTTCPIITTPRIFVTKNCPPQPTPRGGLFTFTGTVSNPGNVTLTNVFVANNYEVDCFSRTNGPVIGPITLGPGASVDFSGSYTAPRSCCEVIDTLTASGQDSCAGTHVAATATAVCPLLSTPGISIVRICPASPVPVGGLFVFTGSVTNTGDVVLTNVFVFSSQSNASTAILGPIDLAPGESEEFTGSYTVLAGSDPATNTVTARGIDTCQARIVSAMANCSGPIRTVAPLITLVTAANGLVTVSWTASPGTTYCLQCKGNSQNSSWINLPGNVTASGTTASKDDAVGSDTIRLYRIMVLHQ